ncbi:DUF3859 domain-containing protein [Maritimibacter sp. DP1N21-5]|uniref:DUF3859 domain-containing protein n=1 Tax=Maritimibacter sp. DP1N21-5 TaxID=2836867 RepID=UPI001C46861E|nr:DUF3859 domain-containing protein [Maritimibacter sp. DP1N21-5]MBV7407926.1 DUF3859 domain-containing protein [Maritimibacter sp. DP1N21-5]
MFPIRALALSLVLAPAPVLAADHVTSPMILEDFGIFCPRESSGQREAPGTERGFIELIEGEVHPDFFGNIVPGTLDISFGIRFMLEPGQGERVVDVVTSHPPMGPTGATEERYDSIVNDFSASISLFTFDDPYEVVLGEWSFAVELDGVEVLRKTFVVVPPDDTLVSPALCRGPSLMM